MHTDHDSPIRPKWVEKTIQVAGDLVGDPLDSKKTISQFHNASSTCELNILERLFMLVVFYTHKYQEASLDPIRKTSMQEYFKSLQDNETWEFVPLPSKRKLVQCKWAYRTKVDVGGVIQLLVP